MHEGPPRRKRTLHTVFVDHYDSFSANLLDWLREAHKSPILTISYDDPSLEERLLRDPRPLVFSPGPHRPERIPSTMRVLRRHLGQVPIFGVCLGHQCLGHALGGRIIEAHDPFHGSSQDLVILRKTPFINSLSTRFRVARYNSLVVERTSLDERWVWAANSEGECEGIYWEEGRYPALGVQFHPESFLSEGVEPLLLAWRQMVQRFHRDV